MDPVPPCPGLAMVGGHQEEFIGLIGGGLGSGLLKVGEPTKSRERRGYEALASLYSPHPSQSDGRREGIWQERVVQARMPREKGGGWRECGPSDEMWKKGKEGGE